MTDQRQVLPLNILKRDTPGPVFWTRESAAGKRLVSRCCKKIFPVKIQPGSLFFLSRGKGRSRGSELFPVKGKNMPAALKKRKETI